jgi:hypothetical protein
LGRKRDLEALKNKHYLSTPPPRLLLWLEERIAKIGKDFTNYLRKKRESETGYKYEENLENIEICG